MHIGHSYLNIWSMKQASKSWMKQIIIQTKLQVMEDG